MPRLALAVAVVISTLCARSAFADEVPPPPDDKAKDADAKPPQIHLVVDGEPGLLLERRQTVAEGWSITFPPAYQRTETWEVSCVAPCNTIVDAGSLYRINGSGVATSYQFTLPQGRAQLRLHLVSRPELLHGAGVVTTIVGGLVTILGIAGLVSAPIVNDAAAAADLRTGGWVSTGVGIGIVAVGLTIWLTTHSYGTTDDSQVLGSARSLLAF